MTDSPNFEDLWNALPEPALSLNGDDMVIAINNAAELFFSVSAMGIVGKRLDRFITADSRLMDLVRQTRREKTSLVEHGVELAWPDRPTRVVDMRLTQVQESPDTVLIIVQPRAIAEKMDRSLSHRSAARSVAGLAAMLAHEIRNPLAGISGAAQLLEMTAGAEDAELADLIQSEVKRIGRLVERVEMAGETRPGRRKPVNIHTILDAAQRAAFAGFARHARFRREYDPSLPHTIGDADQLMQIFQNLLKNAAEAIPPVGGQIWLRTRFRPGVKITAPGGGREALPLEVSISDNGVGVPEDIKREIFDPFVTSKSGGSGLGLALVSKIVADHGGVVECESDPGWTTFRLLLPVWAGETATVEPRAKEAV